MSQLHRNVTENMKIALQWNDIWKCVHSQSKLIHFVLRGVLMYYGLTVRSHTVSRPRESGLNFSNRSDNWQAPRQQRCRDACQISERYNHYNTQSRGFETSLNLAIRRLTAWWIEAQENMDIKTHWGRDKMFAVSQTTLLNAFSWMKLLEFRLRFYWSLFIRVQLTIIQHWFRYCNGLAPVRRQAIIWSNDG